jgi:hypothetical protein
LPFLANFYLLTKMDGDVFFALSRDEPQGSNVHPRWRGGFRREST